MDEERVEIAGQTWRLGAEIGAGGFGSVRVAESDGEQAAIKFVPKAPGAERELLLVDLPGVPHVVPVLATGETATEWLLLMPLADGSLRQHLRHAARLELGEALAVLTNIATALAGLASVGVVHRDLKPENVLLLDGAWCLADFGISRYAEASTSPDTRKYSMTSAYAAPEQWRLMRATAATDIYAFGVIAHELLIGHRPFPGPGQDDFRDQHLTRDAPLLENVGAPLSALVGECLYKEPAARPPAANLVARLAGITAAPATAGLAQLQQANRQEVARLGAEASRRSLGELDAERRQGLSAAARSSFKMIGDELQEAIRSAAPAATLQAASNGWSLHLSGAQLKLTGPLVAQGGELHAYGTSLGIEVVASASISVTMSKPNYYGYRGRSHSLWFCNARDPEYYQWFELAFMHSPLMRLPSHPDVNPFSRGPDKTAAETLSTTMTEQQLAWPFTPIGPGQLDDFIGRWGSWLAAAAGRQLQHPTTMPERPTGGSYRKV